MGHNLDLVKMYGLDSEQVCPKCNNLSNQYFEEYDIDCGDVFQGDGVIKLDCYCGICDYEWEYEFKVKIEEL